MNALKYLFAQHQRELMWLAWLLPIAVVIITASSIFRAVCRVLSRN